MHSYSYMHVKINFFGGYLYALITDSIRWNTIKVRW